MNTGGGGDFKILIARPSGMQAVETVSLMSTHRELVPALFTLSVA